MAHVWCALAADAAAIRRLLAVMSERGLEDIGICRAEIATRSAKPFWRDNRQWEICYEQGILQPGDAAAAGRLLACRQGQQGDADPSGGPGVERCVRRAGRRGEFRSAGRACVFANVKIAVEAAGWPTIADIVKMNAYLVAEVDPGRAAEVAGDPRPLRQHADTAGQHAGRRQPPGAAGLADRDRRRWRRSIRRLVKRKRPSPVGKGRRACVCQPCVIGRSAAPPWSR